MANPSTLMQYLPYFLSTAAPVSSMVSLPVIFSLVMAAILPSYTPTLAMSSYIVSRSITRPLLMTRS